MLIYTVFLIRSRPGALFDNPIVNKVKNSSEKEEISKTGSVKVSHKRRTLLDHDNMSISFNNLIGNVSVVREGREVQIENGFKLRFKDIVKTDKSSVAIIRFAGNSILKLFSNSELFIGRVQHQDRSALNKQFTFFKLRKGAIVGDFINRGDMHLLEIESEAGRMQVRGTQFLYLYNSEKKRLQAAVLEGVVKISGTLKDSNQFIPEAQGLILEKDKAPTKPVSSGWVEKINWPKLAKGSGIDLYDPHAPEYELASWKKRRGELKKMPEGIMAKNELDKVKKSKTMGLLNSAVSKALNVGKEMAEKGAEAAKSASPVGQINEAAENMKNYEQSQKDRKNALDSIDGN